MLKTGTLQKIAVVQWKPTVVTDLLHDGIGGVDQALVPVRVVTNQRANFVAAKHIVVVCISMLQQTVP